MERDIDRLEPDLRAAILEAGRILDLATAHSHFSFVTLRAGGEEYTAYYVFKESADGGKNFTFELLID